MGYFDRPSAIQSLVWQDKYRQPGEGTIRASLERVVNGVYAKDPSAEAKADALEAVLNGDWVPAGRIHAGAGTDKRVTLINCYVSPTIEDSLATTRIHREDKSFSSAVFNAMDARFEQDNLGIMEALNNAAYTMQMGGGIGMDFSSIRPKGAIVKRTGSVSSGVLPFMDMWHSMCGTIMSSGSRRGAMMGCLRIDHPDVIDFIKAKQTPGRLTNFNVSVLVPNAFMQAVAADAQWYLTFPVAPADGKEELLGDTFIYQTVSARWLWDLLLKSTYEYAEPGVIFIDRVNQLNNLNYCETIAATNPCGEQPLPPNGACNLGAVNLANMVVGAFGPNPGINFERLEQAVRVGVRFLDNVLDVTQYPTEAQKQEALNKRRIGLGVTGLGNMLQQLQLRYGSTASVSMTYNVMKTIAQVAYATSNQLAKERGPFPLWHTNKFNYSLVERLDLLPLANSISKHGLRNGVLLTVAPTGTTSLYYGNVSSGLEPPFALEFTRKVLQPDGSHKSVQVQDWGFKKFIEKLGYPDKYTVMNGNVQAMKDDNVLPDYMATALELSVQDHLAIQAACQQWVDASISKTINCPADMTFDAFKLVYSEAYSLGCKGCTTYRPSGVRGAVLTVEEPKDKQPLPFSDLSGFEGLDKVMGEVKPEELALVQELMIAAVGTPDNQGLKTMFRLPPRAALNMARAVQQLSAKADGELGFSLPKEPPSTPRPRVLRGTTYKIRWPRADHAHYVTINDREDGTPFEIFINSKSVLHAEWTAAVTRLISAIFRRGGDVHFLLEELAQVHATEGGVWEKGVYIPSMVAMLGTVIQEHLLGGPEVVAEMKAETEALKAAKPPPYEGPLVPPFVPTPGAFTYVYLTCTSCGQPAAYKQEGCLKCLSCGHSDCG